MLDIFVGLSDTPVPGWFVIAGIFCILLAVTEQISSQVKVSKESKKLIFAIGIGFLFGGLGLYAIEAVGKKSHTIGSEIAFNPIATPSFRCDDHSKRSRTDRTPQEDILCIDQMAAEADLWLNDTYKALIASVQPQDVPLIRREQRAWMDNRGLRCPFNWSSFDNSEEVKQLGICVRTMTTQRTAELEEMLNDTKQTN